MEISLKGCLSLLFEPSATDGRMEIMMLDLVIIGYGPAGISAAIYAARAELDFVVLEQNFMGGGQIFNTDEIDNYPGMPGVSGYEISEKMTAHGQKLGVRMENVTVTGLEDHGDHKTVLTTGESYEAKAVLIATGARHSQLFIPGEENYTGKGVSFCATCDGAFYRKKTVAVVGGGNVAVEDAIFLSKLCEKVYVVHRRDELRAEKVLQTKLLSLPNVEMVWNSNAVEVKGEQKVNGLVVKNKLDESVRTLDVDGVFIAVGIRPNNEAFAGAVGMDDAGYIIAGEDGVTDTPGIFVAGDGRTKELRQVVTAVSDGANAIHSIQKFLI